MTTTQRDVSDPSAAGGRPVRAVIFDMDGLLLDTESIYKITMHATARALGAAMSDEVFLQTVGVRSVDCRHIIAGLVGESRVDEFFATWRKLEAEHTAANAIEIKPGVQEVLDFLDTRPVKRIIATSTKRERALRRLGSTGLLPRFPAMVCGDEIVNGKPAPDIFFAAARAIEVSPGDCLVLEDSEPGARAAHAAGMRVIIVPDLKQPSAEVASLALAVVPGLAGALPVMEGMVVGP